MTLTLFQGHGSTLKFQISTKIGFPHIISLTEQWILVKLYIVSLWCNEELIRFGDLDLIQGHHPIKIVKVSLFGTLSSELEGGF